MKRPTAKTPGETRFTDARVKAVFDAYPPRLRARLLRIRKLILDTAARTTGVGTIHETLKWGQPSYLTLESGSGSTIRIDRAKSDERYAVYFHCQTDLIETFRRIYADEMIYEGNRSIVFDAKGRIPEEPLRHCIGLALTYHFRKSGSGEKTCLESLPARKTKQRKLPQRSAGTTVLR